jgi:hypothetical protein
VPVSLLVATGGKDFKQVSMENLGNDKFNMLASSMFRIDYTKLEEFHDETSLQTQSAYAGGNYEIN